MLESRRRQRGRYGLTQLLELRHISNINLPGVAPCPYQTQLILYLRGYDGSYIPVRNTTLTHSQHTLSLHEYNQQSNISAQVSHLNS